MLDSFEKCEYSWPQLPLKATLYLCESVHRLSPQGIGCTCSSSCQGCRGRARVGLELGCGVGKGGLPPALQGLPFRVQRLFRQNRRLFTCKTSFAISPPDDAIIWKLVLPTQSALMNKNYLHNISFIPSFIEQVLTELILHARHRVVPW